ncbi:hypothetical protein R9C00_22700 [Flammeovirgaceae bacterium SG7u.111]|nr:hypothetical protein [Flammeovirgaceae bacterium SG7u.132]WPO34514.1 hypothetical protein R9C00_22700 [Flammeovirgaceae bacterium SG7u.111]
MKRLIYIVFVAVISFLTACEDNLLKDTPAVPAPPPDVPATPGNADFTTVVSLGNSLTAGYMDGALYDRGQNNSFPNLFSKQLMELSENTLTEFNQPDINAENGYFGLGPGGIILGRLKLNASSLPEPIIPGDAVTAYAGDKTKLNNFGVPGILLGQALTPDTGNPNSPLYNPLYARFASAPGTSTIIGDAVARQPSFFTFWLGSNDVLGYAISGATNDAIFTDPAAFQLQYGAAMQTLLATGADGVVANIPDVVDIPFFKLVPYNALVLDQATADQLNDGFAPFNAGVDLYNSTPGLPEEMKRSKVAFQAGPNNFVIDDKDLPQVPGLPSIRHIDATELVGLTVPQDSISIWLAQGKGIPDRYVLTSPEITKVSERTIELNQIIAGIVAANSEKVALVDIYNIFKELAGAGVTREYDVTISADVAPPYGMFSLDGVHPNARGSAYVANKFIEAINAKFGSTIKYVPLENSPINDFPPSN